jgi:hypothetical protein
MLQRYCRFSSAVDRAVDRVDHIGGVLAETRTPEPRDSFKARMSDAQPAGLVRRYIAEALKVRDAGAMTCPPDGVTRRMASPR